MGRMKGVSDVRILVLALCVALLIEVTWKWKMVVAGFIAVPFFLPAVIEPMHAGIVATVIRQSAGELHAVLLRHLIVSPP